MTRLLAMRKSRAFDPDATRPRPTHPTHPLLWTLRRELWEHRSLIFAPLAAVAVALSGFLVSAVGLPATMQASLAGTPSELKDAIRRPFDIAAVAIIATTSLAGLFYALGALNGERRDRSILFWKSLPVSDATAVLVKAAIPIALLPLVAFLLVLAAQAIMLLASTAILSASGVAIGPLWGSVPVLHRVHIIAWSIATLALWHAPIYAWALLVSGWARRMTLLWATLPPLAAIVFDRMASGRWHVASWFRDRLIGSLEAGIKPSATAEPQMAVIHFAASPGLWIGLAITAACLAAAVRLRRNIFNP
ncbi:hypothetical protein KRZ98_16565 [Sphingobium sp. AS12]|uniref:hypothetical protein n=1 Tax=Sphingobium sp. AS12 TaxID=2849495 RepID=UPI001C316A97|nr:hypothetical protein [Sphingobium sp. AS12]MBV2149859.1 hypothetical protein [Sphingobium sp. AS12]